MSTLCNYSSSDAIENQSYLKSKWQPKYDKLQAAYDSLQKFDKVTMDYKKEVEDSTSKNSLRKQEWKSRK